MKTGHKLAAAFAFLIASFLLLRVNGWFGLGVVIGLPLAILLWFDLGRELRATPQSNRIARVLGILMGVPQALFGLLCLAMGLALICWVLCNSFWHRDPNYTGGWLTFGVAPALTLFGVGLAFDAFKRAPASTAGDQNGDAPPDVL